MSNSSAVAQQIARSLVASGVREVVLAPGSRSAPLVYALAPLAEAGVIRTHIRLDERDAGFLALGLARGLRVRGAGSPVALVTTSGSAVANLHPAVLEASYGHLPLIALTADRPARLRGTGANQTIDDQAHVLSDVRARFDVPAGDAVTTADVVDAVAEAVARSMGTAEGGSTPSLPGAVQLNVQFDTPLVPTADELEAWTSEIAGESSPGTRSDVVSPGKPSAGSPVRRPRAHVTLTEGTVIVAGDAGGHPADTLRALAEERSLPVLAEPSSPLAFGGHDATTFVPAHARVLSERTDLAGAIRTVIVHGKPTLTRPVAALLADTSVTVQRVPDDIDDHDLTVTGEGSDDGATWARDWVEAGNAAVAASREDRSAQPARAITEHLAAQDITLFAASSNTIRYLSEAVDVRARIHASRGLAGIDGLVSTTTGLSLGLGEPVVLLIGDVAMLHDVGGLLTPTAEDTGAVTIVVLNDDGGAIFSGLEHSQPHVAPYLERYFTVPHGRVFGELANAYGWEHSQVSDLSAFEEAFSGARSAGAKARRIIEVRLR
ncbi:2-succinyl-5-enolpyruvyl-6-hydroxy-3-cyclohexene-1-carboxylic-acid synthase [Brevibacterium casei]|nr:2-succinyl-5-enolpyruvyl-6-hydroxy-3-cyclohexene-1-carboxylic-acid synthase [Brevibacterium casei]